MKSRTALISGACLWCSAQLYSSETVDWTQHEPAKIEAQHSSQVEFNFVGEPQLAEAEKGIMRRDPSDVIKVDGTYYIWYTKVLSDAEGYPGGWGGTVWYATSPDGFKWSEQGMAVDRRDNVDDWDSFGTYTPNVVPFDGKYYLAYTAQTASETEFQYRKAAIGMAVADSPDGPWTKLPNNPMIAPGNKLGEVDGFLCDDAAFVIRDGKLWMYYKGFPMQYDEAGGMIRYQKKKDHHEGPGGVHSRWNTWLTAATATRPEQGFEKVSKGALHRGHEVAVWTEVDDSVGSLTLGCGPPIYYRSHNGIDFEPQHRMNYRPFAAGLYRADFREDWHGGKPQWGMAMQDNGLRRFEIKWPEGNRVSPSKNPATETAELPNFIIIFTDDQGYQDLGCFGHPSIKTPHIDRMAGEGVKFTNFYSASSFCSPSRAALLTGCYPKRIGMDFFVLRPPGHEKDPEWRKIRPLHGFGLNPKEITIAKLLKRKDYATAAIGKWHVGYTKPFNPLDHGFDSYYGMPGNFNSHPIFMRDEEILAEVADNPRLTELYTEECIRVIEENREEPFFIYLAHTMPHKPLAVTPTFEGKSDYGLYGDVIECLDWSTGEIIKTLKKHDLDDNTIIIFTSDNGPSPWSGVEQKASAYPLRGHKGQTWEGGMRVPCVMWGPGYFDGGRVNDEVASTMDFLPTIASMAGVPLPDDRILDGKNIKDLILGKPGAKSPHEAFFFYNWKGELSGIRQGKWKLYLPGIVKGPNNDLLIESYELFDLEADISETKNLAVDHPQLVQQLVSVGRDFDDELSRKIRLPGNL